MAIKKILSALLISSFLCSQAFAVVDFEDTGVDATTQYLSQADGLSTDFNGANQKWSSSAWIRPENDTAGTRFIAGKYAAGVPVSDDGRQYRMTINGSDQFNCTISSNGTTGTSAPSTSTASDGVLYHVGCIYDDVTLQTYVNGAADGSAVSFTSGVFNSAARFSIGAQYGSVTDIDNTTAFDGLIDDVCVWNTNITATQMAAIYNSKIKGFCKDIEPANLVIYCALTQCANGAACTVDFNCSPGSAMTPTQSPVGAGNNFLNLQAPGYLGQ